MKFRVVGLLETSIVDETVCVTLNDPSYDELYSLARAAIRAGWKCVRFERVQDA